MAFCASLIVLLVLLGSSHCDDFDDLLIAAIKEELEQELAAQEANANLSQPIQTQAILPIETLNNLPPKIEPVEGKMQNVTDIQIDPVPQPLDNILNRVRDEGESYPESGDNRPESNCRPDSRPDSNSESEDTQEYTYSRSRSYESYESEETSENEISDSGPGVYKTKTGYGLIFGHGSMFDSTRSRMRYKSSSYASYDDRSGPRKGCRPCRPPKNCKKNYLCSGSKMLSLDRCQCRCPRCE